MLKHNLRLRLEQMVIAPLGFSFMNKTLWLAAVWFVLALPGLGEGASGTDSSHQKIEQLVRQLGHGDFFERERAQKELFKIGMEAFDALAVATSHEDVEIAARAKYLIRLLSIEWTKADDPESVRLLLQSYDTQDEPARLDTMSRLLELPDDEGLPALCRLVRFERSPLLSKQAALKIIGQKTVREIDWNRRKKLILPALGRSPTAGANWLRLELDSRSQPEASLPRWSAAIAAEEAILARSPQLAQSEIVGALLRRQAWLLAQLEHRDELQRTLLKLVEYERGTEPTLVRLFDFLAEHKAFDVLDTARARFAARIEASPLLLYASAQALGLQGKSEVAEQLAQKAQEAAGTDQAKHVQLAFALKSYGLLTWAEREYRMAIKVGHASSLTTILLQTDLAETLHDQQQHQAAAEVLQPAVTELAKNEELRQSIEQRVREASGIHSRMLYFQARHAADKGDMPRHIELLDQAIAQDASDADVLIALYRLPNADAQRRQKTLQMIRAAAVTFRKQILQDADDPSGYNQFAWLIGNTEGDQEEAIRHSHKSLELRPGAAGYLDTLGRCYYAKGDYEKAVHYQSLAVDKEPHSLQMKRQLELFRTAWAVKQRELKEPQPTAPTQ